MSEFKQAPAAAQAAGGDDHSRGSVAGGGSRGWPASGGQYSSRQYSTDPLRARTHARATDARAQSDDHAGAHERPTAARADDDRFEDSSGEVAGADATTQSGGARGPSGDTPGGHAAGAPDGAERASDGDDGERDAVEVEVDIDELLKLTAQRDEYLSLAQRTQADFENYRKRVARENKQALERGVAKVVKELLPALDNLDRAIAAAASEDPLLEGVRLVRAEISAALARVGVESFSPAGEAFDPAVHEAMATIDQPEGGTASGTVAEVYEPGYRLGETIIRPARVVVAA